MPEPITGDVAEELLQWAAASSPADPRGDLAEKAALVIKRLRKERRHYEALRMAQWSIIDAVDAAGHIASRACDCFEGQKEFVAFAKLREAITALAQGAELRAVRSAVSDARENLDG